MHATPQYYHKFFGRVFERPFSSRLSTIEYWSLTHNFTSYVRFFFKFQLLLIHRKTTATRTNRNNGPKIYAKVIERKTQILRTFNPIFFCFCTHSLLHFSRLTDELIKWQCSCAIVRLRICRQSAVTIKPTEW